MSRLLPPFGIVIPVRNEAGALRTTIPAVLESIAGLPARLICVCNGCTDDSALVIASMAGPAAELILLSHPSKTAALQAGDDVLGALFPRFYLDADVILSQGAIALLMRPLLDQTADLVGARRIHSSVGVSPLSAAMARTWDALPHARQTGFLGAVGMSAAGRATWGRWPEVLGDDVFVAASIRPSRRMVLAQVTASTRPPLNFSGWVKMRYRWRQGERDVRAMGLTPPIASGQRRALIRQMLTPSLARGAWAFAAARLLVPFVAVRQASDWQPDREGWL